MGIQIFSITVKNNNDFLLPDLLNSIRSAKMGAMI